MVAGHGRRARARGARAARRGRVPPAARGARQAFLVLTNNSIWTPRDLAARLSRGGSTCRRTRYLDVGARDGALPREPTPGRLRVCGRRGGTHDCAARCGLHTHRSRTRLVLGETRTHRFRGITGAIRLVDNGARFIATNPDNVGAEPQRVAAATGLGGRANPARRGVKPYYVGKPNPLMIRSALARGQFRVHGDDRRPHGHQHLAGSRRGLNDPRAQRADGADRRRAPSLPPVANRAVGGGPDRRARLASARGARRAFTSHAARLAARSCLS